ncbi:MAG TPA: hypothetical protein VL346_00365 [Acidobacteriaceae bacterium]|nr:hypothetical protein [Acidobacteriaceae bacterium]
MSNLAPGQKTSQLDDEKESTTGTINLMLVYSLLGLALLAAIFFACFIVGPFYLRR